MPDLSPHNQAIRDHFDALAPDVDAWARTSRYYHAELEAFYRSVVPPGATVLEVGCGAGRLLAALEPRVGLGIDLSSRLVARARERFPHLTWEVGQAEVLPADRTFDYVVLSDLLGYLEDIWTVLRGLHAVVRPDTRVIVTCQNYLWEPILHLAERLGQRMPSGIVNWLPVADIENFLELADFEVVKRGHRFLVPKRIPLLSGWVNRVVARLPGIRRLGLIQYVVARPRPVRGPDGGRSEPTCSVIVPCRNERDNVAAVVARTPSLGAHTEIVFVDGASTDGTRERIEAEIDAHVGKKDVRLVLQPEPRGKGEAVRLGFDAAAGEILFILDADLTVPPEDLEKFYRAIVEGRGELINGSRLVYPMERQAMRFLNYLGNKTFSALFTWILEQRITDTLCGTKVLRRGDYLKIEANRAFFGDFDPFGDFDLLFGAAKLNLKIVEVPVRYRERVYGTTKISRFRHGLLLFRMSWLALRRLKFS